MTLDGWHGSLTSLLTSPLPRQVFAVVVASPPDGSMTTASVSYTCGFYHIPVICTHSRDYIFSDKVGERLLEDTE